MARRERNRSLMRCKHDEFREYEKWNLQEFYGVFRNRILLLSFSDAVVVFRPRFC